MLEIKFDGIMEVLEDEESTNVICDTREKAIDLLENLDKSGYIWNSGDGLTELDLWDRYKSKTHYSIRNSNSSPRKVVTYGDSPNKTGESVYLYEVSDDSEYKGDYLYTWELFGFMDSCFDEIKNRQYRLVSNTICNSRLQKYDIVEVRENALGMRGLFLNGDMVDGFSNFERWEEVDIEPISFQELIGFISEKDDSITTLKFSYERDVEEGGNIVDEGNLDEIIYRLSFIYNDKALSEILLNGDWLID